MYSNLYHDPDFSHGQKQRNKKRRYVDKINLTIEQIIIILSSELRSTSASVDSLFSESNDVKNKQPCREVSAISSNRGY